MNKPTTDHNWPCWSIHKTLERDRPYPWSNHVECCYKEGKCMIHATCSDPKCDAEIYVPAEELLRKLPIGDDSY